MAVKFDQSNFVEIHFGKDVDQATHNQVIKLASHGKVRPSDIPYVRQIAHKEAVGILPLHTSKVWKRIEHSYPGLFTSEVRHSPEFVEDAADYAKRLIEEGNIPAYTKFRYGLRPDIRVRLEKGQNKK